MDHISIELTPKSKLISNHHGFRAKLKGLKVEYVDPYKTSQECFQCGKVKKTNRRGPLYTCSCGYKKQADVNASFVISTRPSIAG
ncbi:transposase [Anoxybacillus flavithermus]|uniref:zinc ribbon domain-containing protein n=1 Tax=Anoxybacillus flavithermus TaxID=33934 RepID=UPI001866DC6A|nr:transposase [Anoxybacillus flavithermus]